MTDDMAFPDDAYWLPGLKTMADAMVFPENAYGLPGLKTMADAMAEGKGEGDPAVLFAGRCARMCAARPGAYDIDPIYGDDVGVEHGVTRVILRRNIPGIGVGDIIARLELWGSGDPAILSPAAGTPDPAMGTSVIIDSLADFITMAEAGVDERSIASAATILAGTCADSLVRIPLAHAGGGLDAFLAFRAAISPDGDPLDQAIREQDERASLAPGGRGSAIGMFGWMDDREGFEHDPDAPIVLSAMCRPAILGYDPSAVVPPTGEHDDVRAMLASMRHIPGFCSESVFPYPSRGILMGVTRLLAAMDGSDRDRDMALMGAARTLENAGVESGLRYGDCDAILIGDTLADAIMDGIGLPTGFVMETLAAERQGQGDA